MQSADVTATFCATLVDEWVALGVRTAVIAPGSRSTPMALALVAAANLRTEVFHDERSAAFAALGCGKATEVPALLLCTSGTAAVNFHPAVVESSHAEVPLIVLTADRPPELQGVGAPQTIDQKQLFGSAARAYFDAGVADDGREDEWRRLAQRALQAATSQRPGPVQVNLPFREPLVGTPGRLMSSPSGAANKAEKSRPLGTETLAKLSARLRGKRGVIVAGARGVSLEAVLSLARAFGWPVIAEPTGGCRGEETLLIRHADAWLREEAIANALRPQAVLRFGALPASKVVNSWLRDCAAETTTITSTQFLIDPDRRTSMHLVTDADALCADLASLVDHCDGDWLARWTAAETAARAAIARILGDETQLSEPGTARSVVSALPVGAQLVVSSSMPIRDVEWYAGACDHLKVLSNRGANGIDGVVSTAVGVALGTGRSTGLLIGDVAFLHDSNGLIGLADRGLDVRIVAVDNRGGGIFSFLPQRNVLSAETFEKLFGTPHASDLALLAQAHGLRAQVVSSTVELKQAVAVEGPHVIIVKTNRDDNVSRHEEIHRAVIGEVRRALTV